MDKNTNFERYKDELMNWISTSKIDLLCIKDDVLRPCDVLLPCDDHDCSGCMFASSYSTCQRVVAWKFFKWLLAPPHIEVSLTTSERKFCELVGNGYICKGKNGLYWCKYKPKFTRNTGLIFEHDSGRCFTDSDYIQLNVDVLHFWNIQFENMRPGDIYSVEDLLQSSE